MNSRTSMRTGGLMVADNVQLPPGYRQVIELRYDEGLGFAEIGARLGSSKEAARKRCERALEALKDVVQLKETDIVDLRGGG